MLEEKLHLVEEKISSLLSELKRLRNENARMQEELTDLRPKAKALVAAQEEAAQLNAKIQTLQNDLQESGVREQEFRDRLRSIIDKIDALEQLPGIE
jgi:predicted RNase H-like nuclease (RuvC/YqgF family)